ncbi:MAG TPA: ATP-binding protein [Pyrinomonadaceae bacterium]|nr:ATP-binding protein [Pyrinomonadaceae bacterium]
MVREPIPVTYRNRFQSGLTMLTGLFLLAVLFAVLLYALTPATPAARGPILLASFIAILLGSLLCILFVLRWLLRPYQQLVGEAQRASIGSQYKSQDEAEFVLETFQSVVAQLQEQRKALEQLSAAARERANSAEKFSERIVASLPSGLIAFDGAGLSMAINTPGRALLEVNGAQLGEPYKQLFGAHEELAQMVGDCLQTGTVYRRTEIEAVTSDGKLRRLGATVAPIELPPERGPRGALCLLTDITEVTELREQVALKNNLESLGEMSAGLAHEFKNAIATLQGYAQLLQSMELNEKAQVAASSLLNEVRNLSSMVTAFLNFARPQPLQLEEVSISDLVADCATELRLDPVVAVDPSLTVRADERMLRQALLNLMRNGTEANPEGRVFITAARENESIVIQVRDTGPGISPADLRKIFIPFFTTKAKGHGIGLALTHRIITQHGGTLTAANSPDGGALFTIRI